MGPTQIHSWDHDSSDYKTGSSETNAWRLSEISVKHHVLQRAHQREPRAPISLAQRDPQDHHIRTLY